MPRTCKLYIEKPFAAPSGAAQRLDGDKAASPHQIVPAIRISQQSFPPIHPSEDIDHSRSKTKSPQTRPRHRLFFEQKRAARGRRRKEKDTMARLHALALLVFPILDWLE